MLPKPPTFLLASALFCLTAAPLQADELRLRDGRVLKGDVEERGDELEVQGRYGSIIVAKKDVVSWQKQQDTRSDAYKRQLAKLGQGSADERYQLGVWARDKGLTEEAKQAFRSALSVNPDHLGSRGALGFVQYQGQWLKLADRNRLLGLVKYKGRWVTLDEKARLIKADEVKRAEAKRKKEEAKARKRAERRLRRELGRRPQVSYQPPPLGLPAPGERYTVFNQNRYRLLETYYGPLLPGGSLGYGVFGGLNQTITPGFIGPYFYPLRQPLSVGRVLSNNDILTLVGAARRGRPIPRHIQQPVVVVQSPAFFGYGGARRFGGRGFGRQPFGGVPSGFSLSYSRRTSRSSLNFGFGGRSTRSRGFVGSGFGGSGFRGYGRRRSTSIGSSFSGHWQSRSGRRRISFRFTP